MKILINTHQLDILKSQFTITEQGLHHNDTNLINESKIPEYLVRMLVHGLPCALKISAYSSGAALSVARRLFKGSVTITGSTTLIR